MNLKDGCISHQCWYITVRDLHLDSLRLRILYRGGCSRLRHRGAVGGGHGDRERKVGVSERVDLLILNFAELLRLIGLESISVSVAR
jgi:hypothetical protein